MRSKWHLGFYNWASTPTFRGFDSFYGFYEGSEDYFKHTTSQFDLHREPTPRCGEGCSQLPWDDIGTYSAFLFSDEALAIIKANRASATKDPLFIYLAYQSVHAPAQAPQAYIDMFNASLPGPEYKQRRTFAGMVHCFDEGLGNVTQLLKTEGMWTKVEPTIIVFTDENGAPTDACAQIGGNNLPHRGGKCSIWEGGTKGISIVSSPLLTKTGFTYHGIAHAVDVSAAAPFASSCEAQRSGCTVAPDAGGGRARRLHRLVQAAGRPQHVGRAAEQRAEQEHADRCVLRHHGRLSRHLRAGAADGRRDEDNRRRLGRREGPVQAA